MSTLQDKSRADDATILDRADPDCVKCAGRGWRMVGVGGDFEDCDGVKDTDHAQH